MRACDRGGDEARLRLAMAIAAAAAVEFRRDCSGSALSAVSFAATASTSCSSPWPAASSLSLWEWRRQPVGSSSVRRAVTWSVSQGWRVVDVHVARSPVRQS